MVGRPPGPRLLWPDRHDCGGLYWGLCSHRHLTRCLARRVVERMAAALKAIRVHGCAGEMAGVTTTSPLLSFGRGVSLSISFTQVRVLTVIAAGCCVVGEL